MCVLCKYSSEFMLFALAPCVNKRLKSLSRPQDNVFPWGCLFFYFKTVKKH